MLGHCQSWTREVIAGGEDLHEGIVDGDDEDFTGVLELCVRDVVWNVGVGAGWAWITLDMRAN